MEDGVKRRRGEGEKGRRGERVKGRVGEEVKGAACRTPHAARLFPISMNPTKQIVYLCVIQSKPF